MTQEEEVVVVEGHVVVSRTNRQLSRTCRWVKHRDRRHGAPSEGIRRAWVHPDVNEAVARAPGGAEEVSHIIPAKYDSTVDCTILTGEPAPLPAGPG
jgi:hypothetical protein